MNALNRLVEFVLRVADLAEAEARAAKGSAADLVTAALVWMSAAVLFVLAIVTVSAALFLALRHVMPPAAALLFAAALLGIGGAGCILQGRSIARRRSGGPK